MSAVPMRRDFADRDALIAYLKAQFPEASAVDDHVAEDRGGRAAALERLRAIDTRRYAATRNMLSGSVSRLSAYVRHGALSLAEVRDAAVQRAAFPHEVERFVNELAWRDYWQRVYAALGDGVWEDQEPYKTGFDADDYADALPDDVSEGTTGLACMDAFSAQLRETGYLHNHARMWVAAYIVHWRRVKWQAGAAWFLEHLLDGDPASNNLSWQWVASTFSAKPYFFNRENLERYSEGVFCAHCPLNRAGCPFAGSYERIEARLFPNRAPEAQPGPRDHKRRSR
jgi:deoxyribodipyrimidine photo-lyase